MKNLKKVLSLVLALAMALSLMTVAFAADASDYKDYDKVTHKEAVDVMTAVGVFNGTGDGSNFSPDGTLTREQAAKIITYMLMGQEAADRLVTTIAPYSDVAASRWSAGSIAYCTNEGIIAGTGDGTFEPTRAVTGLEFAKMLLVALGYDATIQGLEGSAWAINTATLALGEPALDTGMEDVSLSQSLTREQAAQMAFNAMKADIVEYDSQTTVDINGATVNIGNTRAQAVTTTRDWGANIDSDGATGTSSDPYTVQFAEQYCRDLSKVASTNSDAFGRPAVEWRYNNTSVGTYADTADYSYTGKVTKGTLYSDVGRSIVDDLSAAGTPVGNPAVTTDELIIIADGRTVSDANTSVSDWFSSRSTAAAGWSSSRINATTGAGVQTEVYIDDNNNVTIVVINTYVAQASSDYSSRNENLRIEVPTAATQPGTLTSTTLSLDDFAVSDYAEDDYILYTAAYVGSQGSNDRYEIQTIAPAEVVTGVVNSYSEGDSVTVAGTQYSYVQTMSNDADHGTAVTYSAGDEATVVLDNYNNVIYVDEAVTDSGNWVYVAEVASANGLGNNYVADAYFPDGTNQTITVRNWTTTGDDTYSEDIGDGETHAIPAGWYTYTTDSSDRYRLTQQTTADSVASATAGAVVTNGAVTVGQGGNATRANASTVFVIVDEDDNITTYTGIANVPTITAKSGQTVTAYYAENSSGYARFVFVDVGSTATITDAVTTNSEYVYLLSLDSVNVDGDGTRYYTYNALVDGEETTINLADTFTGVNTNGILNVLYYNARTNSDGYVTSMSLAENRSNVDAEQTLTAASVDYNSGVIEITGTAPSSADLVLAADCEIYLISEASNINLDDGADYEVSANISGSSLASILSGHTVDGSYYVERADSEANAAVTALYIFVETATAVV